MTAALERCEWSAARPGRPLPPRKNFIGGCVSSGWVDGKSRPNRDSIPDRPARSSVAIPTELPSPHTIPVLHKHYDINQTNSHL